MNEKIKKHLYDYAVEHGYPAHESSSDYYDTLTAFSSIGREELGGSRWWNNFLDIVEINGMLICFGNAETTGDDSPEDKGWEFDIDTVSEVEAYTETVIITKYRAVS